MAALAYTPHNLQGFVGTGQGWLVQGCCVVGHQPTPTQWHGACPGSGLTRSVWAPGHGGQLFLRSPFSRADAVALRCGGSVHACLAGTRPTHPPTTTYAPKSRTPCTAHQSTRPRIPQGDPPRASRKSKQGNRAIKQTQPGGPLPFSASGPNTPGPISWMAWEAGMGQLILLRSSLLLPFSAFLDSFCLVLRLFLRHGCPPFSRQLVADDSETCARHSRLIPYHSASINFNRLAGGRRTAPGRELQLPGSRVLGLGLVSTYIYLRGTALLLDAISCRTRRSGLNACGTD